MLFRSLWFRNTWEQGGKRPSLRRAEGPPGTGVIAADHPALGQRYLSCEGAPELLFTENETNTERLFGTPNASPFAKDGINDCIVSGRADAVNPEGSGTKASAHYRLTLAPGEAQTIRLRLNQAPPSEESPLFGSAFESVFAERMQEADAFYENITPPSVGPDAANVMRQALAGMLWTKQYYLYEVDRWLNGHDPGQRSSLRNNSWFHMVNAAIISMPDKWEYPWYAAWDLAFHTLALAMVDPDFAKNQLDLMLRERYLHPNGQIPAYEWNFSDVNPPVHAWAALFIYRTEKEILGAGDVQFLGRMFQKLLMNFTWWVNRKDRTGQNVFEGGFLGLDNIGGFDRSAPLPTGGYLEQADGTAWMALFAPTMLEIASELAVHDPVYQEMATKFFEHFVWIASAMNIIGEGLDGMWDEEDGFYYDLLRLPDGSATRLKVRSLVGLLPLAATTVFTREMVEQMPEFIERARWFRQYHERMTSTIANAGRPGVGGRLLLSLLTEEKLRRVLARMLDENEFLSDYGIRSLSWAHLNNPYIFYQDGQEYRVDYLPADSNSAMFGGNSNWRGPIWFPMNVMLIRALLNLYAYYGDDFTVECPTGSGNRMNLFEVSKEIGRRLTRIFLRDESDRRPVFGYTKKFQDDPNWRDYLLFYEYFHGDNGAGVGASHQTGWTGLVARIIQISGYMTPEQVLGEGARRLVYRKKGSSPRPVEGPAAR